MKTPISEAVLAGDNVDDVQRIADQISPLGTIRARHLRANAEGGFDLVREWMLKNVVTRAGLNRIAARAVTATGNTPFYIIGVGTVTATHSLDSAQAGVGEVLRKTSAFTGANAQSREWIFCQCTIGGASDSVTSVALDSVFISDYPNSHASTGIIAGVTNGLGVTLAGSDLLDLTYRFRVGSHNLSHST